MHGLVTITFHQTVFDYPVYSSRFIDQINDPHSTFGSLHISKKLTKFLFSSFVRRMKNRSRIREYEKLFLYPTDVTAAMKNAQKLVHGLTIHTSVRRCMVWRDYLTYLEMGNFLYDLFTSACRDCFIFPSRTDDLTNTVYTFIYYTYAILPIPLLIVYEYLTYTVLWLIRLLIFLLSIMAYCSAYRIGIFILGIMAYIDAEFLIMIVKMWSPNVRERSALSNFYKRLQNGYYPRFETIIQYCAQWKLPPVILKKVNFTLLFCCLFLLYKLFIS